MSERAHYEKLDTDTLWRYLVERCVDVRINVVLDTVCVEMKIVRYRYLMRAAGKTLREALVEANVERSKMGCGDPM